MDKNKFAAHRGLSKEAVQVVVRCRPMNTKELANGFQKVVEVFPSRGVIEIINPRGDGKGKKKFFTFDAVYDDVSTQEELYNETAHPLVSSILNGFNGTIFAYGQTGTGKTYTMEGSKPDPAQKGIIPRSFDQIFNYISRSKNVQYLVRTSYLEIYQEEIRDLLNKDRRKTFELREAAGIGVYVKDLSSFVCTSAKEIEHVMFVGNKNRSIGATNMNEHSSRSHAIFMITIEMSATDSFKKMIHVGKLNLIDLAGSERQSKTGATGERLKESSKINLSLSALGNVISALADGRASHIPYRDSKLTRILQDSLGGNSKTIMVANIGPASYNYEETLTTLRYANRAKNIKNKPMINEDPKDALLKEYEMEIERLKEHLAERARKKEMLRSAQVDNDDDDDEEGNWETLDEWESDDDTKNADASGSEGHLAERARKKEMLRSAQVDNDDDDDEEEGNWETLDEWESDDDTKNADASGSEEHLAERARKKEMLRSAQVDNDDDDDEEEGNWETLDEWESDDDTKNADASGSEEHLAERARKKEMLRSAQVDNDDDDDEEEGNWETLDEWESDDDTKNADASGSEEHLAERARKKEMLRSAQVDNDDDDDEEEGNWETLDEWESDDDTKNADASGSEGKKCSLKELEEKKELLAKEKYASKKLEMKIKTMESKLLCGGKNIVDHTNEQQIALEHYKQEIADRKKREVAMRQKLELQEESALEIRDTYTTLQQEVDYKTKKLIMITEIFESVKQEIHEVTDKFNFYRRELEVAKNYLIKDLKWRYLVFDHFIPLDERIKFILRSHYVEEDSQWHLVPLVPDNMVTARRPVSTGIERRRLSNLGRVAIRQGRSYRYQGRNILNLELIPHQRLTSDFPGVIPVTNSSDSDSDF